VGIIFMAVNMKYIWEKVLNAQIVVVLLTAILTLIGNHFIQNSILNRQLHYEYKLFMAEQSSRVMNEYSKSKDLWNNKLPFYRTSLGVFWGNDVASLLIRESNGILLDCIQKYFVGAHNIIRGCIFSRGKISKDHLELLRSDLKVLYSYSARMYNMFSVKGRSLYQ